MASRIIRTAFILGAGLGLRLRPLTEKCPKPLLPVGGRPLITYAMEHLQGIGITRFIINTHHCPESYRQAFPDNQWQGLPVVFRYEKMLLDTGGGLKNIEDLIMNDEQIIVYNGDVLTNLPLEPLIADQNQGGSEVTLALRSSGPLCNVAIRDNGDVCDLRHTLGTPGERLCQFTGIYVMQKSLLQRIKVGGIESIIEVWLRIIRDAEGSIRGKVIDDGIWYDLGTIEEYEHIRGQWPLWQSKSSIDGPPKAGIPFIRKSLGLGRYTLVHCNAIKRGGSDRLFYRCQINHHTFIFMRYGTARQENALYTNISRGLKYIGIRVPDVIAHDPQMRFILMEDLGKQDLWSLRSAPWPVRKSLYCDTLAMAARLHNVVLEDFPGSIENLQPAFGPDLYRWERDYFREYFIHGVCNISMSNQFAAELEDELNTIAAHLMNTPVCLIHRDLQSQNIMIHHGKTFWIDFQGMRLGSRFYDLASLLYDPYVLFTDEQRVELLRFYFGQVRIGIQEPEYMTMFHEAAVQRLMQALGAYGYLGIQQGKQSFLLHIPQALDYLKQVASCVGLSRILKLISECRDKIRVSPQNS
jgi:NDP-sugar pyrophosphorylase family protein/aminoglycoside/choline kinase family phosphotransferase